MATYAFTTTNTTFSLSVDGVSVGTWDRTNELDTEHVYTIDDNVFTFSLRNPYYSSRITPEHSVTINGVEQSGTVRAIGHNIKDSVFFFPNVYSPNESTPYGSYVCLFKQSGAANPTVTVLNDSLGGSGGWTRGLVGKYSLERVGVFTPENTWIGGFGDWYENGNPYIAIRDNSTTLGYYTMYAELDKVWLEVRNAAGAAADLSTVFGATGTLYLPEIRVY
jgi:hypothetical protein